MRATSRSHGPRPAARSRAGCGPTIRPSRALEPGAVARRRAGRRRRRRAASTPVALARLVGYDDVQTVASAALKLLPLDPPDVSGWVLDALPAVDRLATDVAALTSPGAIPARGAPQIEAWAEAHAHTTRRLFSA